MPRKDVWIPCFHGMGAKEFLATFLNYHMMGGCSPVSSEGSRRHKQMTLGLYNFTLLFSVLNFWYYILSPNISLQARQLLPLLSSSYDCELE